MTVRAAGSRPSAFGVAPSTLDDLFEDGMIGMRHWSKNFDIHFSVPRPSSDQRASSRMRFVVTMMFIRIL